MIIARLLHWPSALIRPLDPGGFYSAMRSPAGGTSLHTLPLASCEGAAFGAVLMIRLRGQITELRADDSKEVRPPQIGDWSGCVHWEIAYSCVASDLPACSVIGLGRLQAEGCAQLQMLSGLPCLSEGLQITCSALSKVPSHTRWPCRGSLISAAHLPGETLCQAVLLEVTKHSTQVAGAHPKVVSSRRDR